MNLAQYLENSARNHPNKIAVRCEEQQVTFQELDINCNRLANGLSDFGLAAGDRCVVMIPNSVQSITIYYALAKIGAIVISVNFLYWVHELEHIFADSKPKAFIGSEPYLEQIRKVLKKMSKPSIRLALGISQESEFMDLEEAYSQKKEFSMYQADDNDTLNILYTSGTTGVQKGVLLTHKNLARTAKILAEMRGKTDPKTVVIGVLPLYHIYGITSVVNVSMYLGLTIELFSHFDPEKVIQVAEKEEQTILFAVPTMYNRLIQLASENPPKRSSLKFCVSGGASLPVEFLHRFETLFKTRIYEGYGLTEAPVCVENPYGKLTKPGSIGLAIPEFSARIVDEKGNGVHQGEVGELTIKGPGVMKGYLNLPKETKETIKDGWLYTGDLARMDEEGFFYIVDRKKEVIVSGGENIYPREIEEVLIRHLAIADVAVVGIPDPDWEEAVKAFVVLREGQMIDEQEVIEFCKSHLASYKKPKAVSFVHSIPRNPSGKALKRVLREKGEH